LKIIFRKYDDDDEDDSADEEVSKQMQEVIILKTYYVKIQLKFVINSPSSCFKPV